MKPVSTTASGSRGVRRRTVLAGLAATAVAGPLSTIVAKAADDGPELRVAMQDFYGEQLDPIIGGSNSNYLMLQGLYDGAFEINPETGEVAPGIVKAWETAPDGLSWTFHLRDDVVFHDGSKLTADDLAYSYGRAVSKEATYGSNWRSMLGDTPNIEVLDPYTLRIHTAVPQPLLAYSSAAPANEPYLVIFPKAYIEKNGIDNFRAHPIGSGPYKFVSHTPGDNIQFAAVDYPHWSGVTPDFKRLTLYLVPEESTRKSMIETDQIDVIEASMETAKTLKDEGFGTFSGMVALARFWTFGAYRPQAKGLPLADVRVREALSLAINRQEIIDTMFYGQAQMPPPSAGATPDMTAATRQKWADWSKQAYRYDPDAAKKLLADAGYPDGFSFDFWSVPDSSAPFLADLVLAVAGYWEKLGIHANVTAADKAAYRQVRTTSKSPALIGKMACDASPVNRLGRIDFVIWTSQYGVLDFLAESPDIKEFDADYLEAKSSMDPAHTADLLERMVEISTASWCCLPIVAAPGFYANGRHVSLTYPVWGQGLGKYFAQWKHVQS
ncbi:MAG: ABC transporter substrate-binding protein [Bauldia sp.]